MFVSVIVSQKVISKKEEKKGFSKEE
jgi:hypothetical protein